jgi:hypothetical protein
VPAADHGAYQTGCREEEEGAVRDRSRAERGDELAVDRVTVIEQRHAAVRGEYRAQPAPHAVDGRAYLPGRGPPRGSQQVHHVDEVGQYLAVVGGSALVVAAVGQDLPGHLAGQPAQRQPQQALVGEEDGQAGKRLQSLDQVVAADVVFQVTTQESSV